MKVCGVRFTVAGWQAMSRMLPILVRDLGPADAVAELVQQRGGTASPVRVASWRLGMVPMVDLPQVALAFGVTPEQGMRRIVRLLGQERTVVS